MTFRQSLSKLYGTPTVLDNKPVFMFYSLYVLSPPCSMLGLTPKRSDSSNFMANGNNIEKGARGMEMFPTLKGIRRSVPTVLKVIVAFSPIIYQCLVLCDLFNILLIIYIDYVGS